MQGCIEAPGSSGTGRAVAAPLLSDQTVSLLLVSANQRWSQTVRAAAAEIGGGGEVLACGARDALLRLATTRHYSHLLLQPSCADGLFDELVTLTAGGARPRTSILLLGPAANPPPNVGVIQRATRRSVRQALIDRPAQDAEDAGMPKGELRRALAGAMIEARYQPIVRIADRRPIAVEALARLNHPTRGMIQPDSFVPQIEAAGLAARLTELIADRALADLAGPCFTAQPLQLTLNFPLDVLLQPGALQRLDARRAAAGIAPDRIILEMTESRPVEDLVGLRSTLERLRADGYRISIDDVAPGVALLDGLLQLPFTSLKFDKHLVQRLDRSPEAVDFTQRVIAVARERGLAVVAEGVEDVATWQRVAALGVQHAQGFLVARPLPATAMPIWLEAWHQQPAFD